MLHSKFRGDISKLWIFKKDYVKSIKGALHAAGSTHVHCMQALCVGMCLQSLVLLGPLGTE